MKKFVVNKVLKGSAYSSYSIVYSPLIIGVLLFFFQGVVFKQSSKFPLIVHFFPFPFLLFQVIWMETVSDELLFKVKDYSSLKVSRMKKLFKISKWALLVLSIQISLIFLLMTGGAMTNLNQNPVIKYLLIFVFITLILLMLLSYYTFYSGSRYIGKLLSEIESSFYDIPSKNTRIHLTSVKGLFPWGYIKTHERIKRIIE
ncbi:hypothetical protein V6R21_11555 [Limibacter armeniacum]|uniref:hypothetical protein n=1 Tax=Limibacter armeniacum TaxID=466084 RepID=UPI002FE62F13